eukprot:scaffold50695_cov69-Phaeocystis_antarctica.AAC.2
MVVTCPDGVALGQTIQIAQSNGVPMQVQVVQVPPGPGRRAGRRVPGRGAHNARRCAGGPDSAQ